jgi:hypothetical protein
VLLVYNLVLLQQPTGGGCHLLSGNVVSLKEAASVFSDISNIVPISLRQAPY